jgi:predicted MPP superfamily phosphohydrolase
MKNWSFFIFFSIVLLIYGGVNFYILKRGLNALDGTGIYRNIFLCILLFLIICYPIGRLAEQLFRNSFTDFLVVLGSLYLGIMVYTFLFLILIDLLRLGNFVFHYFPDFLTGNPEKTSSLTTLAISVMVVLIVVGGHINTLFPRVRQLEITIAKKANGIEQLNLVVVSDIHLGTVIQNDRLKRIVSMINELKPDLVLLPGDIVDEDVAPVMEQGMAKTFQKIQSRFGIYAITGNHEYFSGVKEAVNYLEQGKIKVLQDEYVKIAEALYLIGRKDLMAMRMADGRKSLEEIVQKVDRSLPLILMDHQPYGLEVAKNNGIDLQLSGHTHHGQLFPFHYITKMVYELSWGYLRRGDTHYYVSCGVGTWGPPLRTNSVPEIIQIKVRFAKND